SGNGFVVSVFARCQWKLTAVIKSHRGVSARDSDKSARRKRAQKRARKRALLGHGWFRRNSCNSFGMNGGDDETRTRDLCRDRAETTKSSDSTECSQDALKRLIPE